MSSKIISKDKMKKRLSIMLECGKIGPVGTSQNVVAFRESFRSGWCQLPYDLTRKVMEAAQQFSKPGELENASFIWRNKYDVWKLHKNYSYDEQNKEVEELFLTNVKRNAIRRLFIYEKSDSGALVRGLSNF